MDFNGFRLVEPKPQHVPLAVMDLAPLKWLKHGFVWVRQVDVLASRRRAIDKALLQLERMRVRRSLAEHQLKQLRLDLSQAEARRLAAPELSSRILDIRQEVDAFDQADELLADQ